jgi:hypothetical protein
VAVLVRCSSAAVFRIIVLVASAICFGSAAARAECVTGLEQPQICGALSFRVLEAFKGISLGATDIQNRPLHLMAPGRDRAQSCHRE